ncbi:hypothetical protein ACO0QE_001216 [Hanseniaspora vineae]
MARKLKGKITGKGLKSMLLQHQHVEQLNKKKAAKLENELQMKEQKKKKQTGQAKKEKLLALKAGSTDSEGSSKTIVTSNLLSAMDKKFIPFEPTSTVMLVGEGDFSFARSLIANAYIQSENLIVTSFDNSVKELELKYPHTFRNNYDFLNEHKVAMFFKIDATNLTKSFKISNRQPWTKILPSFSLKKLDYIMFNFPHNGKGIKDQDRNIAEHQKLMAVFFQSCLDFFKLINTRKDNRCLVGYAVSTNEKFYTPVGKVIVSLFDGEPYNSWQIKVLGKTNGGWKVDRSNKFQWENYPEYHHKRTNSELDTTKPASQRPARLYVFEINSTKFKKNGSFPKRGRNNDDDIDSE